VWHDLISEGVSCGLHRIERLMRQQGLKARPRRRRLPPDLGERQADAIASTKADVFDYIERFYNPKRRHSTIGYMSPMDFETKAGLA
jgi:transposase InsO family protein